MLETAILQIFLLNLFPALIYMKEITISQKQNLKVFFQTNSIQPHLRAYFSETSENRHFQIILCSLKNINQNSYR